MFDCNKPTTAYNYRLYYDFLQENWCMCCVSEVFNPVGGPTNTAGEFRMSGHRVRNFIYERRTVNHNSFWASP